MPGNSGLGKVLLAATLLLLSIASVGAAGVRVNVHFVGSGTVIDSAAFYYGDEPPKVFAHTETFGKNMDYRLSEYLNVDKMKGSKSISVAADYFDFFGTISVLGGETSVVISKAKDVELKYYAYGSHGDETKFSRTVKLDAAKVSSIEVVEEDVHVFGANGKFLNVDFYESFLVDLSNGFARGSTRLDVPSDDTPFRGEMHDVVTVPFEFSDVSVNVNVNSLKPDNVVAVSYVHESEPFEYEIVTTTIDGVFSGVEDAPFFYECFNVAIPSEL